MTREELLKRYTEGKRDFPYTNLSNVDLSNVDLRGADLSNVDLRGADLRRADLSGADLSKANLFCANLWCANLSGANLSNANLWCANLSNANLSDAKYKDVVIKHVRVFSALYKYQVWAIIAEDGSEWIRMGCFFRKREEWNENFWNNDNEFPNDNSEDSNMRLAAFNFACKWIDERKNAMEKTR